MYRFFYILSWLPFWFLYGVADVLAFLAYHVFRYRRKVVHQNLVSSFPEKSPKEIATIEKKFYRFLGDYFVETLKLASMSEKNMRKHLTMSGLHLIDEATARGESVVVYLGHYGCWEWISSMPIYVQGHGKWGHVYHPLQNGAFDKVMCKLRGKFGAMNIPMKETLQTLIRAKKAGTPTITGFIADQAPGINMHLFLDFLNHDTGVYTGPERIAKFLNARVLYGHMSRPRRGHYHLDLQMVTDSVKKDPVFATSRKYFELLEANIKEQPELWLWSHRRWKRTRQMFMEHHGEKAEDMLKHL